MRTLLHVVVAVGDGQSVVLRVLPRAVFVLIIHTPKAHCEVSGALH